MDGGWCMTWHSLLWLLVAALTGAGLFGAGLWAGFVMGRKTMTPVLASPTTYDIGGQPVLWEDPYEDALSREGVTQDVG